MTNDAADEQGGDSPQGAGGLLRSVRLRAFVVGFLLCLPVCYAVANQGASTYFSLMVPPISALLILILLNIPLRLLHKALAFSQTDLVVVYAIVSVAAAASAEWTASANWPMYTIGIKAQTDPVNRDFLAKHIPSWLASQDSGKIGDIPGGGRDASYVLHKIWVFWPQFLGWGALLCSAMFAMICINSLMRGAWCERERLAFPIIQLPVAMSEGGGNGGMWRSRAMWIAFGIMFFIDILNGLNYLYPNFPSLPVKELLDIQYMFKDPPWSNIGEFKLSIYPFMAAIGLFMPSDLLISVIAFYLLRKATHVALASYGIPQDTFSGTAAAPGPPYFDEQTWGGVFAMFLGAMWVSREYLKEVWAQIRSGVRADDQGVTHRWAFAGLLVSFSVVVGYGLFGGLPLLYIVPYVAAFLIFCIVLTRMRAQLGPPSHEFAFFGPTALMGRFMGTRWMNDGQITWVSQVFFFMNRIHRTHPMPLQLEAMKMGQIERIGQKKIFMAIAGATLIGFVAGYFFYTANVYRTGTLPRPDVETYIQTMTADRHGPDIVGIAMTIFGFAMVLLLDAVRFRFPGFPLHPAGYVLSMNFGVDYYWFGLVLALIVKSFVQRYYGLRGYDKLRSVALGILLAEYAAETIWMIMALVTHQSTYTISFNERSLGAQ